MSDDLDSKMKIDKFIDNSYNEMMELFNTNEESPAYAVYQTMAVTKGDSMSYLYAYINYYMGVFEGIFISLFLEEFDAYPTPSQKTFIQDSFEKRFHSFINISQKHATKNYKKDLD